eukprot:CAMPEP_0116089430 /NCGR_PEP_ID=MMETSP0327-20121206/6419_1 /TAXON_ID=44447 /ORGANISM="Pseudo-nitzschia delicatissima, Strain B596" /LENGTH=538 /DNA_ID=CAMNT_0003580617 /DNA_START=92 /DNA_END=1708 /DNA_ORIENTATION=+
MSSVTSPAFRRLVQSLKKHKKTLTVVEQCCGGLIQTSIMAQPGASSVFVGGSVPYNTKKGKGLLLNDEILHKSLLSPLNAVFDKSTEDGYIDSKFDWTSKAATAFCESLETDYAVSEGGAAGPTFNPTGMEKGFAVLSVAGRKEASSVELLDQKLILSPSNDREGNMRLFADAAADLLTEIIEADHGTDTKNESLKGEENFEDKTESAGNEKLILDRSTSLRTDEGALNELKASAKYVVVRGADMLFRSPTELAFLSYEGLAMKYDPKRTTNTFLGLLSDENRTPLFSIDVVEADAEDEEFSFVNDATDKDYFYANVRTNAPLLNSLENEISLHSMAYANWQRSNNFCSSCGGTLELIHGGTAQQCTDEDCRKMFWPRQDPSMIASIGSRCGTKILLARSHRHPPRMHTVLAGFVEAGETFEKAVARETWEEVGIRIDEDSVKYVGSQPWPFPQSCMVAFEATADDTQPLNIDENELVEARWFDREEVFTATQIEGPVMQAEVAKKVLEEDPSLPLLIPPKQVIARKLIDTWLEGSAR